MMLTGDDRTRRSPWPCDPPTSLQQEVRAHIVPNTLSSIPNNTCSRGRRDQNFLGTARYGQDDSERQGRDHNHQRR